MSVIDKILTFLNSHKYFKRDFYKTAALFISLFLVNNFAYAVETWFATTLDNDAFIGNDNGYTNGLNGSIFEATTDQYVLDIGFWVKPLQWTLPDKKADLIVRSYTIGQAMSTPTDITLVNPPEGDSPYGGLLYFTTNYAKRYDNKNYADRISTSIGIVGPLSFGEEAQKVIHKIIGSDEPKGWDTQLSNELVFQFSRARAWRGWHSSSDNFDFIGFADLNLGTIESSINTGIFLRAGKNLEESYQSVLFMNSRISNPIATKGWNAFVGIQAGYVLNQIFLDGNTFKHSRSVDYDPERVGALAGVTFSWGESLLSVAFYDLNLLISQSDDNLSDLTQFGTITWATKI